MIIEISIGDGIEEEIDLIGCIKGACINYSARFLRRVSWTRHPFLTRKQRGGDGGEKGMKVGATESGTRVA